MNEAENTFRALKNESPLATGLFCGIGIHKWTMWATPQIRKVGAWVYQEQYRQCVHCGKMGIKQLTKD
jgi:hypothetical protein